MKQVHLLTPVAGQLVPLESVHDPVFSQGMMGQGFGIEPTDGQVVAPISGKVTMVAASLHAIGFTGNNGLEVLVHLGIDTVELADRPPFKVNVQVGDTVEAGEKVAMMDLAAITSANKDTTVIMAVTNTADMVTKLTPELGEVRAGVVGAVVELKEHVAEASVVKGKGGKYDELATQIIAQVGGPVNVKSVIHCITRVRFYLKDEGQANDEAIRNLKGVIDVAKAGGQYQVVIGPAVTDVYDAIVGQLGAGFGDADASAVAMEKEANRLAWLNPFSKFDSNS